MALAKYGGIISELRGKEGGVIFSRNRYGSYMKQKISPTNPQTQSQQNQRSLMGQAAQIWAGLTAEAKQQWVNFGSQVTRTNRFGDQTTYSGFNACVKCNRNLLILKHNTILTPEVIPAFPNFAFGAIGLTNEGMDIAFTPTPIGTYFQLVVEATAPIYGGRRFVKNLYRQVMVTTANVASPLNLVTDYTSVFGAMPVAGTYVGFRVRVVHNLSGWDSAVYTTGAVVEEA